MEINNKAQHEAASIVAEQTKNINEGAKKLRIEIKALKTNAVYSDDIGKNLGILGESEHFDADSFKPTIKLKSFPGRNTIVFVKDGAEGMRVYGRIKGEATWELLGTDFHSPYSDERPVKTAGVAEMREYRVRGILHDNEIGQFSDIVSGMFEG